jgi:hypothetical protein
MKQVNYIAETLISADIQDTPEFIRVVFTKKILTLIAKYQVYLKTMKVSGLKPASINVYLSKGVSTINPLGHHHLNGEEAATLVFESDTEKQRWVDDLDGIEDHIDSTLEEFENKDTFSLDCLIMTVTSKGVFFQYTLDEAFHGETTEVPNKVLKKINKMLEG